MKSRQEIKEYAKYMFSMQRGACILAAFLVALLSIGYSVVVYITSVPGYIGVFTGVSPAFIAISSVLSLLSIPISLLILVLTVNLCGSFVMVYYGQQITGTEPYSALKSNFGRKLGGMYWRSLWLFLWAMVFIFPAFIIIGVIIFMYIGTGKSYYWFATDAGEAFFTLLIVLFICSLMMIPMIIKSLQYSMSQYILASNPNVTATNALKLSKRMTKGYKGEIFMMHLSFIGWHLIDFFTFGILGILYVTPYKQTALAGLFVELRHTAIANGVIYPHEFDGVSGYYPQPQYPQPPYGQQPPIYPHPPQPPYGQQPPIYPHSPQPPYGQQPPPYLQPPHTQPPHGHPPKP